MYKAKELKDQSLDELEATLRDCRKNLWEMNHKFKFQKNKERPHEVKHARKDIARLLTVITEKKRQNNKDQSR